MEAGGDAIIGDIARPDAYNPQDEEGAAVIEEVIMDRRLIEENLKRSDMIWDIRSEIAKAFIELSLRRRKIESIFLQQPGC